MNNSTTDSDKKEIKGLEISLGLLVGYVLAGTIYMVVADKSWGEAFSDEKLLLGFAGIALSIFIYLRVKKREQ